MSNNVNEETLLWNNAWNITPLSVEEEITQSYIEYAMSVIVQRALPDVRDGCKPVIRRILFAMYMMKLFANTKHKKSARIVGEVLGKYHPHGDTAVYDAMVRLAQPFSLRYPLVDGQGNFGSIDGDGAAAQRYTEAKLTKIAEEMMQDIMMDTVDRRDNYDGTEQEPIMLSTRFPNHLCNGTMGIAVGMATNMPPHNLTEVINASLLLLTKPEADIDEIMTIIKGPDLPLGGIIFDSNNIREVYKTGKGGIVCRGRTHIEQNKKHQVIVIDDIPYLVNKAKLVEKIGELVVDKKIDGITNIIDESNKDRIRVTIHLKTDADAERILIQLYKMTDLQSNINLNNVSLIDKGRQPRLLNVKDLLQEFVDFRRHVVHRRSVYQLNKAKDRLHILEWLKKAIDIIDAVIETIKSSATKADAKAALMEKFEFSDVQAEYILQMRLQSLVWLEIQKIIDEIEEKKKLIEYLEWIINDPAKRDEVVSSELEDIRTRYGDERRTEVVEDTSVYNLSKSLADLRDAADRVKEDVICLIHNDYKMKVLYQSRVQNIPEETLELIYTHNQKELIVISEKGELVVERLKDIGHHTTSGNPTDLKKHNKFDGNVVYARPLMRDVPYLVMLTNHNNIKKIETDLVLWFKKFPTTIMRLAPGEKIVKVIAVTDNDHIGIVTQQGWTLIFDQGDVRPMGKTAGGVRAIELQEKDKVASMFLYRDEPFVMIYSQTDAKVLDVDDLKIWTRARRGQQVALLKNKQKLHGGIALQEGSVRVHLSDDSFATIHSNDIYMDIPETKLKKLTDKDIQSVFRPREERNENMAYKEEKKKQSKENTEEAQQETLL